MTVLFSLFGICLLTQVFGNLKDHKDNFKEKPSIRLINPNKSDLGRISCQILQSINSKIREATQLRQWRSTGEVVNWFKSIKNKNSKTFIVFDIDDFYPNITESVFNKALTFAARYVPITDLQVKILNAAKQTLLYHDNEAWTKKGDSGQFDVGQGSWDGAETSELVGLLILHMIKTVCQDLSLYRDDGLGILGNSPRLAERAKQKLCQLFSELGFEIKVQTNVTEVNYLDVTFNLKDDTYRPYIKEGNSIQYINRQQIIS